MDVVAEHALAAELGQQGRVDVDHLASVRGGNIHQIEVAREDNPVDGVLLQQRFQLRGGDAARDDLNIEIVRAGAFNPGGIAAGDHQRDLGAELPGAAVGEQVHQRASAAGNHDAQAWGMGGW